MPGHGWDRLMRGLKRTIVCFDPDVRRALSRRASQSHRSISQVVNESVRVALSDDPDPEHLKAAPKRAARKNSEVSHGPDSFESDRRIVENILWMLYDSRRQDPNGCGLGVIQIEQEFGCPAAYLEFHLWFLREKGWIERTDNGLLAITIAGVEKVVEQDNNILGPPRLISESTGSSSGSNGLNGNPKVKGLLEYA